MIGKIGLFWEWLSLRHRLLFTWYRSIAATLLKIELLFLINSCSGPNPWALSYISAGDPLFDSTRLRFRSSKSHSPLTFEMMRFSDRIDSFITLNQFRFSQNPVQVTFIIEGESIQEMAPVYEGAMRIRLSEEITDKLIQALQEGKEIDILVDGFEETIRPDQFPTAFDEFLGSWQLKKIFKGPIE